MEFFLDTAEMKEIETGLEWGMVDGVTTNPSLIAKAGKPYLPTVQEIAKLVPGPVSGEVLATEFDQIMSQGHRLAALADNVVVKVPLTPDGLRAVKAFKKEGSAPTSPSASPPPRLSSRPRPAPLTSLPSSAGWTTSPRRGWSWSRRS